MVKRIRIPPMLIDLVQSAILSLEGRRFESLSACPTCGGSVKGYDFKKKRFARVIDRKGRFHNIFVDVKRFRCSSCGRLCYAEAPFYPDTRFGSPIVDLCVANIANHPFHHVARILEAMQVHVDRGTIRNYASRTFPPIPSIELYGIQVPFSILSLSESAFHPAKLTSVIGAELLRAGSFPSADRAVFNRRSAAEERDKRYK